MEDLNIRLSGRDTHSISALGNLKQIWLIVKKWSNNSIKLCQRHKTQPKWQQDQHLLPRKNPKLIWGPVM